MTLLSCNLIPHPFVWASVLWIKMSTAVWIIMLLVGAVAGILFHVLPNSFIWCSLTVLSKFQGELECINEEFCDTCINREDCVFVFARKRPRDNSSRFLCAHPTQLKHMFHAFRQLSNPIQCPQKLRAPLKNANGTSSSTGNIPEVLTQRRHGQSLTSHDPISVSSTGHNNTPTKIHAITFATAAAVAALPFCSFKLLL